jgi:hypothetical protein
MVGHGHRPVTGRETTMQAIVQDRYGSADVLELADIDQPVAAGNEVLMPIQAAGQSFGAEDPAGVQQRLVPLLWPFMQAPAQGASASIYRASAPELAQVTGRYFAGRKPKRSVKASYDQATAARPWQVSAQLVGLTCGRPMPRPILAGRVLPALNPRQPGGPLLH